MTTDLLHLFLRGTIDEGEVLAPLHTKYRYRVEANVWTLKIDQK